MKLTGKILQQVFTVWGLVLQLAYLIIINLSESSLDDVTAFLICKAENTWSELHMTGFEPLTENRFWRERLQWKNRLGKRKKWGEACGVINNSVRKDTHSEVVQMIR